MRAKFEYLENTDNDGWCFEVYDLTPSEQEIVNAYPDKFELVQAGIKNRPAAIERADGVCISIRNQPIYDRQNASFDVELPTQEYSPL